MTHDALKLSRALQSDDDELLSPLCKSIIDGTHVNVPRRSRDDDRAQLLGEIAALTKRITALETSAKRTTPRNKKMTRADLEMFAASIGKCIGEELQPLTQRIDELEKRSLGVKWAGIWSDGTRYEEGSLITDRGSLWLVTASTSDRPGDNASAYRLVCKSGSHSDNGARRHAPTATRN